MPMLMGQDWIQQLLSAYGGNKPSGNNADAIARFLQSIGVTVPKTKPMSIASGVPSTGGGMSTAPPSYGGTVPESTISGGEIPGVPGSGAQLGPWDPNGITGGMTNAYMRQLAADATIRPPGGAPWWTQAGSEPYRKVDPNSSLPAWQQLGYYSKEQWQEHGKPTESGMALPSLTDPNTGIYHYELYTPEYQNALLRANQSNYLWRPTTSPPPFSFDQAAAAQANANPGTTIGQERPTRGAARPIPWWMTGGSGINPGASSGTGSPSGAGALWQLLGFGSKDDWRAAGKPR